MGSGSAGRPARRGGAVHVYVAGDAGDHWRVGPALPALREPRDVDHRARVDGLLLPLLLGRGGQALLAPSRELALELAERPPMTCGRGQ